MEPVETSRSAWVLPSLSWDAVSRARARLNGGRDHVPTHMGDIELQPLSRELLAWWDEVRGARMMPEPDDIDPRGLVELLPYFRMMRWEGEGELIFRIFGSALAEAAGIDLTGYSCFAPGDYAGKAEDMARLKLLHRHPCGLVMHRDLTRPDGSVYTCEFMTLPVAGGAGGLPKIVGTIVPCRTFKETELPFTLKRPLTLRRAVFIDIGFGVPIETGLSL